MQELDYKGKIICFKIVILLQSRIIQGPYAAGYNCKSLVPKLEKMQIVYETLIVDLGYIMPVNKQWIFHGLSLDSRSPRVGEIACIIVRLSADPQAFPRLWPPRALYVLAELREKERQNFPVKVLPTYDRFAIAIILLFEWVLIN